MRQVYIYIYIYIYANKCFIIWDDGAMQFFTTHPHWRCWFLHEFEYVWYCGNFYGCDLKKNYFIKSIFSWDWFDIYICLVKIIVKIEVE